MPQLKFCHGCGLPFPSEYHIRCAVCRAKDRVIAIKQMLATAENILRRAKSDLNNRQEVYREHRKRMARVMGEEV